jgi:hypothetical protein
MSDIAKKQEQRYLFLKQLYDQTDDDEHIFVDFIQLGAIVGQDENTVRKIVQYLTGEGLVKSISRDDGAITHYGVVQVEQALKEPNEPTQFFPPIVNMNIILEGTTIQGGFNVLSSIQDSYNKVNSANTPDDLKTLLKQLAKEVAAISEHLSVEKAEQVARDLENLTAEATSENPRKEWWQLSVEGLKQAAKDVGEIGEPVLKLATTIVTMLLARGN